ncbi:MAG: cation diffusion facilitator family transporter [Fervidobacterium nodosum]
MSNHLHSNNEHSINHSHDENSHNHAHDHFNDVENLSGKKLFYVVLLNFGITLAEFIGGLIAGSLALVSDSMHNLSDALSIILAYFAHKISLRGANKGKTFGYGRAKIISAFVNSVTLMVITVLLIKEAVLRLIKPEFVHSDTVIIVGTIGLIANILSMIFLKGHSEKDINIKSAYLHMLGDAFSSVAVVLGAILIKYLNIPLIDPILTIFIALYIGKESFEILIKSLNVLMQSTPHNIDVDEIIKRLENISEIENVHHVHIWSLDDKTNFFEGHINLKEDVTVSQSMVIYKKIEQELSKMEIYHSTIQFEYKGCPECGVISHKK